MMKSMDSLFVGGTHQFFMLDLGSTYHLRWCCTGLGFCPHQKHIKKYYDKRLVHTITYIGIYIYTYHVDTSERNPRKFQWSQKHWRLLLGSQTIRVEVKENDLKSDEWSPHQFSEFFMWLLLLINNHCILVLYIYVYKWSILPASLLLECKMTISFPTRRLFLWEVNTWICAELRVPHRWNSQKKTFSWEVYSSITITITVT